MRSERSLIQTIGRAARHVEGKAILYADKVTGSMQRAIDETTRRREIQQAFNDEHSITPKGIKRAVKDILEGALGAGRSTTRGYSKVAEDQVNYARMTPAQLAKEIGKLEQKMYEHARNLEFEEAARLRDQIHHIQLGNLGLPD